MQLVALRFLVLAGLASLATAQSTLRVSVAAGGAEVSGLSASPSASGDGNEIAFTSNASTLVPADGNFTYDVFVRNLSAGTTVRASVSTGGLEGDGQSLAPSISAGGSRVAFQSEAMNLDGVDPNAAADVFVRDLGASTTKRVSVDSNGIAGDAASEHAAISPDGRYVVFDSECTNLDLLNPDGNGFRDVYLHDTTLATTVRVSARDTGSGTIAPANGDSSWPVVSEDGAYVAFASSATNLTLMADTNLVDDVFTWEKATLIIRRLSPSSGMQEANDESAHPSISADGRWIAFESLATNLGDPGADINGQVDVFRWDRSGGVLALVSCSYIQFDAAQGTSTHASISNDGRYVAFGSNAGNLVHDFNPNHDVYRRDMLAHVTSRVDIAVPRAKANAICHTARPRALSGDGHVIAFEGLASNLVVSDTNLSFDVFAHAYTDDPSASTVSSCDDGIPSVAGCTPVMLATGEPSATNLCDFVITGSNIEGRKNGMLFYGLSSMAPVPWGVNADSYMCVKAPQQKMGVQFSLGTAGQCDGALSMDWYDFGAWKPLALGMPMAMTPGTTVTTQAWFKETSVKTTTLSDALQFTVQP